MPNHRGTRAPRGKYHTKAPRIDDQAFVEAWWNNKLKKCGLVERFGLTSYHLEATRKRLELGPRPVVHKMDELTPDEIKKRTDEVRAQKIREGEQLEANKTGRILERLHNLPVPYLRFYDW